MQTPGPVTDRPSWILNVVFGDQDVQSPPKAVLLTKKPKERQIWCFTFSLPWKQVISSKYPQWSPSMPVPVTGLLSAVEGRGGNTQLLLLSWLWTLPYLLLYLAYRQKSERKKENKSSWPLKELSKLMHKVLYSVYKYAWDVAFSWTLNTGNRKYFCLRFCVCFVLLFPSFCPTVFKTVKTWGKGGHAF